MAFTWSSEYTMVEVAKAYGADGNQMAIVDTLSQGVPILEDAYWQEADDYNSHHLLQAMTEPTGTDSRANYGVDWEIPTTRPVTEPIQGLEVYSRIDVRILKRQRDPEGFRSARNILTVRGMTKTFHDRFFYGNNATYPDRINGLLTRFNALTDTNVYNGAGAIGSSQSSTWAIKWGPESVFMVYPRSYQNFISEEDLGQQVVYDSQTPGKPYTAMVTSYGIHFGLCVADQRYAQRYANIDATAYWTGAKQITCLSKVPDGSLENFVLYVPRRVWVKMNLEAEAKTSVNYTVADIWGRPTIGFYTLPVRLCERLTETEEVVS